MEKPKDYFIRYSEINLLHVRPGDTIVFKVKDKGMTPARTLQRMLEKMKEIYPDNIVLIMDSEESIQIIRKEKPDA